MAFATVQTSAHNAATGASVAITVSPTTLGNLVVVHIKVGSVTSTCTSVTDDKGNVYVVSSPLIVTTVFTLYQVYGVQLVGGTTTITCNFSEIYATKRCGADEYSGGLSTNALIFDTTTTGNGTGTSLAVSALVPAATGELIVASMALNASQTFTAGSNYTLYNGVNPITLRSEYRLSSGASETCPATTDGSQVWGEIAMAYKAVTATSTNTYYYSSSSGNDTTGAGTLASPWANFSTGGVASRKSLPNALAPGDRCLFKAGDTWTHQELIVDSNGDSANPIIIDRYGTGNDPIFNWSSLTTGWTYSGANGIYSKANQYLYTGTVGVDGTSSLYSQTFLSYPTQKTPTTIDAGCYLMSAGTLYIRLSDGSDPAGHSIYVATSGQSDIDRGIVRGSVLRGSYININHIKVLYSTGVGFSFSQPHSNFNDCTAIGCGRDGFLFNGYLPNEMASYCKCIRCYASYCVSGGTGGAGGAGQAYTCGADHCWFVNCTSEYNYAAGYDWLNYIQSGQSTITRTDASFGGAVYCIAYRNGQAPGVTFMFDPGFYVDGGHDILIYGCISHGSGIGTQTRNANNITVQTEYAQITTYNVHIVNNLCYDAQGYNIYINNGGTQASQYTNSPLTYGHTVVNNTCVRGTGGFGGSFRAARLSTAGTKTIIKNNIFLRTAGTYKNMMYDGALSADKVDMDYNQFYDFNNTLNFTVTDGAPFYTLAQWIATAAPGFGTNANSLSSNPLLTVTAFDTIDARLQTTSPCIGTGVGTVGSTSIPWAPPQWVADAGVLADNGVVVGSTLSTGVLDTGTLDMGYHYYVASTTGALTSTNVEPATLYLNTANTVVVTFTTATSVPINGKIVITFPISLGGGFTFSSGGTTAGTFNSGGDGTLTVTTSGATITLTRVGVTAIAAAQAVSINLTNILNPPSAGSTGVYTIKTTDSANTTIDIDSNVSADTIIVSPSGFVTTNISQVAMAGLKINSA